MFVASLLEKYSADWAYRSPVRDNRGSCRSVSLRSRLEHGAQLAEGVDIFAIAHDEHRSAVHFHAKRLPADEFLDFGSVPGDQLLHWHRAARTCARLGA
jgi:hypothetical protein